MEWTNRSAGQQSTQAGSSPTHSSGAPAGHSSGKSKSFLYSSPKLSIALLFAITLLLISLLTFLTFGSNTTTNENKYVDGSKLQAVFLSGGQVYFGKILNLNGKFVRLNNIYYLRVNQQVQPNQTNSSNSANNSSNDVTLVKLGCELHGPEDQMVINRDQVIFWENLKSDGQVAKAVDQFVKDNPNGQKCTTSTNTNSTTKK